MIFKSRFLNFLGGLANADGVDRYSRDEFPEQYADKGPPPPNLIPTKCPSGVGRGWGAGNDCYKLRHAKKLGYDVSGLMKGGKNGKKDDETKGKGKTKKKETETEKDKVKPPPPSKAKLKPKVSRAEHEGKLLSKAQFLRAHSTRATAFEKAQTKHTADLLKAYGKEQTRLEAKHAKELERHKAKLATGKPKKGETQAAFKQRHAAGLLALKLVHGAEKEGLREKHGDEIQSLRRVLEEEHKKFYSKHEDVKKEFLSRLEQGITPPPPPPPVIEPPPPPPPPVVEPPKPEPTLEPEPEPESKVPPSFDREKYSRYAAKRAADLGVMANTVKQEVDRRLREYEALRSDLDPSKQEEKSRAYWSYMDADRHHRKIDVVRRRLLDYDSLQAKNPTLIPAGSIAPRIAEYQKFAQPKLDAVLAQKGKLEEELKGHEQIVDQYRKEYFSLDSEVDKYKASVKGKKKDRERIIVDLEAKRDEVLAKKLAAQGEMNNVRDRHRDEVVKILATDKPMDLDLRSHTERDSSGKFDLIPLPPEQSAMMQRAHSFLTRLVRTGDFPVSCNVAMIPRDENDTRAHYSEHIRVSHFDDTSVHVHEIGHLLDDKHGIGGETIGRRCKEFLEYRTKGEEMKSFKEMFPNSSYKDDEKGASDKFDQAFGDQAYYVGKYYGGISSEILSMGLQKLYKDPITFAEKDPEYFMFVCGIMDGSLV